MRRHTATKGKRIDEDEESIDELYETDEQREDPADSDALQLLDRWRAEQPSEDQAKKLRIDIFAHAARSWEERERLNSDLRKARSRLSQAEARWMAEEGIDEKMTLRQQRKMERKTRDMRREIEDIEDEYIEKNIQYVQWARICDLLRLQVDADTAALGKLQ